jgi:GTPase SAR1 family protein
LNRHSVENISHHQCLFEFVELDGVDGLYCGLDVCPKGFQGLDSLVLVYDVGDRSSFTALVEIYKKALELSGKTAVPVALIANKVDMFLDRSREVSDDEGREFAEAIGGIYAQCSAREGDGVREVIHQLMKTVVNDRLRFLEEKDLQQLRREKETRQKEEEPTKESRRAKLKRSVSEKLTFRLSVGSNG